MYQRKLYQKVLKPYTFVPTERPAMNVIDESHGNRSLKKKPTHFNNYLRRKKSATLHFFFSILIIMFRKMPLGKKQHGT